MLVKIGQNALTIFGSLFCSNAFAANGIGDIVTTDNVNTIGSLIGAIVSTIIIRLLEGIFKRKRLNDKVDDSNTTPTYTLSR